jgi:arylsulfatase A-like enzyme
VVTDRLRIGAGSARAARAGNLWRPPGSVRRRLAALLLAAAALSCGGRKQRAFSGPAPDIVLVTIDTLRADAVGFLGNRRGTTPNLDRLASEGAVFENAHGQNVVTLCSHVNILTGLYPYQHGVRDNDGFRLRDDVPTLATLLKAKGFATAAFIGAFPLDSRFGLARGFDVYDQSFPQGSGNYGFTVAERPGREVVALARRWLASAPAGPRFLWVHLYDCHAPYEPPPPFDRTFSADPYLGEVAGVDAALAPLWDDLRGSGRPLLLVVTGDHGEALGDHGELTHGLFAYEATLHVPLLLWSPGHVAPRRDPGLVRHIDIAPTILEAAGAARVSSMPGRSLLSPRAAVAAPAVSYFEALSCSLNRGWAPLRGVMDGGFKYIDLPIPELYDLARDPKESRNLFSERPDVARRLARALPVEVEAPNPTSPSAEEAAKLRSLGYLTGSAAPKKNYTPDDDPKKLVSVDNALHKVVSLFETGHLKEAAELGRTIVAERPDMRTGYELLLLVEQQMGDPEAEIRILEAGARKGVLSNTLLGRLGLLYAEGGNAKKALQILEPLASSSDVDVLNALGIARAGNGQHDAALEAFRRVLSIDDRNATAYQDIGITELQFGRLPEALAAFSRSIALNDRLPRAWNGNGVALERSGKPAEALAAWQRAVAIDRHQYDALFNIGLVAGQLARYDVSRQALNDFVAGAPSDRYGPERARARQLLAALDAAGK